MRNMTAEEFATQKQDRGSLYNIGSGDCDYGDGDYGYGCGSGSGYDDGSGKGSGDYDYGRGYGCGSGDGGGNDGGNGSGRGIGSVGYNFDIATYWGQKVYTIDGISTLIDHVHGNVAKCRILQRDLTTRSCYVARQGDTYAYGYTLREAFAALQNKLYENIPIEERIDAFLDAHADLTATYPAKDFYEWHHRLTGSCAPGRDAFVTDHGIDVANDRLTVAEFISLTEHDYGGEVIRQLKEKVTEQNAFEAGEKTKKEREGFHIPIYRAKGRNQPPSQIRTGSIEGGITKELRL